MRKRFSLRHAFVLAKRSIIKLTRTPEQLIDVTLQPIIFLCCSCTCSAARSATARSTTTCSTCSPA